MGLNMHFKIKIGLILLFLIISASLISTSSAGRATKFVSKSSEEVGATDEDMSKEQSVDHEEEAIIHERLLRANTKDYGRYDPAPALVGPPGKLIPHP